MADDSDVVGTLNDVMDLWQKAEEQGLFQRLRDLVGRRNKILMLGSSGSGKSNLIQSLHAAAGLVDAIPNIRRTQTPESHDVNLGGSPFTVVDLPGQEHHRQQRVQAIRTAMSAPPLRIVNVVSHGYHEYGTATGAIDDGGQVNQEYLEQHRLNENSACLEWLAFAPDVEIKWILTVVAKADLWWDEYLAVMEHYQSGTYAQQIRTEAGQRTPHIVLPYCSVVHQFFNLAPVSGYFSDADRAQINLDVVRQLADLG